MLHKVKARWIESQVKVCIIHLFEFYILGLFHQTYLREREREKEKERSRMRKCGRERRRERESERERKTEVERYTLIHTCMYPSEEGTRARQMHTHAHFVTSDTTKSVSIHCNTPQRTLQHTATHCNTPQRTATHCNILQHTATHCNTLQHAAAHCNIGVRTPTCLSLFCIVMATSLSWSIPHIRCCSVLQYFAVLRSVLQCVAVFCSHISTLEHAHISGIAVFCSMLQCVAVFCSVLQYFAVCCSVLQSHFYVETCHISGTAVCCSGLQCVSVCYSVL